MDTRVAKLINSFESLAAHLLEAANIRCVFSLPYEV
jgi:hypothetical protein